MEISKLQCLIWTFHERQSGSDGALVAEMRLNNAEAVRYVLDDGCVKFNNNGLVNFDGH